MRIIKTPQELKKILDQKKSDLVLLDVRTPQEYTSGHIKGAVNLNVGDPGFLEQVKQLDSTKEYIVYCRSGGRSLAAYQQLEASGLKVTNCLFGMLHVSGRVLDLE